MNDNVQVSVFDYSNYWEFLQDIMDKKKEENKNFSYHVLGQKLGLKHKSGVAAIIKGERKNLPKTVIKKLSQYLKFNSREEEYFMALVAFNEAKTIEDKNDYYKKMHNVIRPAQRYSMQRSQWKYFKDWYLPVIRELITMDSFDGDIESLSQNLQGNITKDMVRDAVDILLELKLIQKDERGRFTQTNTSLTVDEEIRSRALRHYYLQHFNLMKNVLFEKSPDNKSRITSMTFGCNDDQLIQVKQKVTEFHQMMIDMISKFEGIDKVYQMNLQIYPTSK